MMTRSEELLKKLDKENVQYRVVKLPDDLPNSLIEHAKFHSQSLAKMIATLIYRTEKGYIALHRRADTKVKSSALKKILQTDSITMANEEDMQKLGLTIGHVPMFDLNMPVYTDKRITELIEGYCGLGSPELAVVLQPEDIIKLNRSTVVDVAVVDETVPADYQFTRILSGVNPSSSKGLHLGNFLGAIRPHIEFQDKGECFYFIADYHALNTVHSPEEFRNNTYETFLDYMALGIDTEKTIFFIESHVQAVFELTEILKNVVTLAQMQRMHAYKDKLQDPGQDVGTINMGLFNYPILMAADILLFSPDIIPVGEDQTQHVEIARDIAKSFNKRYGNVFKVPVLHIEEATARVMGTDGGERKMSKTLGNFLSLFASEEEVRKQVMGITTDPNRIKKDDPGDPAKNPIFTYMRMMEYEAKELQEFEERYRAGTIGDVELKNIFFEFFMNYFTDARTKRDILAADRETIQMLMSKNAVVANRIANAKITEIRDAIGAYRVL